MDDENCILTNLPKIHAGKRGLEQGSKVINFHDRAHGGMARSKECAIFCSEVLGGITVSNRLASTDPGTDDLIAIC